MSSTSTVILITGANSGIGYAASKVIATASPNYHVIMGSRSLANGKAALAEIQATGIKGSLSCVQLDVTDQHSIEAAVKYVEDSFGRLDVLVNNAGIYSKDSSLKGALDATLSTNVTGPAVVAEAFRPLLLKSQRAYLLYVSSGLGSLAIAADPKAAYYDLTATTYRMSKAALNMLALQDSKELGKLGVKVFAVCPGLVKSNLRGRAEQEVDAGGMAGDPEVSGQTILGIMEGERDADVGTFVHKDGVYPW